jgi:hypothetical protein
VTDVTAIVLLLVIPVVVAIALLIPARSRGWAADHSIAARRSGILGAALGLTVAAFCGLW